MITLNKIIDGVCKALSDEFGAGYEIYTEDIKQGLEEPCFSVRLISPSTTQFLGKRYYMTNQFCVHYFPKSKTAVNEECFDITDRLTSCLEYITVNGDLTRGTEMSSEIVDGVLSFFVNYDMFVVMEQEEETSMESLTQTTGMKG